MKTFIKTIKTMTAVLMIIAGLLALFTIDNAQDITSLIGFVIVMVTGTVGGISLLISTYPKLTDLSEFDEDNNSIFEEYEREIAELREHNLLLIKRYITFKSIIKSNKVINDSNKGNYPNLYNLLYEEDLVGERIKLQKPTLEQIDRFKEVYN